MVRMFGVESLAQEIGSLSLTAVVLMALVGLLVGVAPGSYPLLAAASGLVAGQSQGRSPHRFRALFLAAGFALGIATVDAIFGALFGMFGFLVLRILSPLMVYAYIALSVVLAFLGLALLRVVRVNLRLLYAAPRPVSSFWAAFLLGLPFGLSTCPACTPLILPVLMTAAGTGDAWMGGILLFVFGLARGIPILAAGAIAGALGGMFKVMFWIRHIERVGGVLLLIAAVAFAYQAGVYANLLPRIGGE